MQKSTHFDSTTRVRTVTYELSEHDKIPNPLSTKTTVYGPGRVRVTTYPDGKVEAKVLEGCHVAP